MRASGEIARGPAPERGIWATLRSSLFGGIGGPLGFELEVPVVARLDRERRVGIGDVSADLKLLLLRPEAARLGLSAIAGARAPTGDADHELGEGTWQPEAGLGWIILPEPFAVQGTTTASATHSERWLSTAISAATAVAQNAYTYAEASVELELGGGTIDAAAGPAFKWLFRPELFVAFGFQYGLTTGSPPFRAIVQVQHGW